MKNFSHSSQNGRWGLAVVAPDDCDIDRSPAEGSLVSLGKIEGLDTYEFLPGKTGQWIKIFEDAVPIVGAVVVKGHDLQGGNTATLVAMGPFAALKLYGYKRRSSSVVAYKNGKQVDLPAAVMAAMGLIPCEREVVQVEIPPVEEGPLAAALRKAGLAS